MIILLGFPKSGTGSFHKLFKELGFNSYHQFFKYENPRVIIAKIIKYNKNNNNKLLCNFKENDCICQLDMCNSTFSYWPQLVDYEQIYNENHDSIFILNKRDPNQLLSSFKRWNNLHKRLYAYSPELVKEKTDSGFIDMVNEHYYKVETFFKLRPEAKFISFDINNDSIDKLKKYIDIKNITIFPRENINKNTKF